MLRGFLADSEPRDVYNLTVEGAHEFYANGVLVHNCDALRYLLVNLGAGPQFILPDAPASSVADGIEPLAQVGAFARRPDPNAPERDTDDDDAPRGMTQRAPWA